MWFCTSGTNAFDELGIWRKEGKEGGERGKGGRRKTLLNLCSYLF